MSTHCERPAVTELRLSAFKSHRGTSIALGPLTLLAGGSGTGKSNALQALHTLVRLAGGEKLEDVFPEGAAGCVPEGALPDVQGRRGFRVGCTVDGPVGPVRLDLAVQAEPELRIVGERLTGGGETLLSTALRDPGRRTVQAAWHTAGLSPVTRAPLPDDLLATALLPLRVAGKTPGQRLVLAAAEQTVLGLRGIFSVAPRPHLMRAPVSPADGLLRSSCDNLSAVLGRTEGDCTIRHGKLVAAVRGAFAGPVEGVTVLHGGGPGRETVLGVIDRGPLGRTPLDRLGDGELRFLALALVLLTGPGVLDMNASAEVLPALQAMTVLADGFDTGLDRRQARELMMVAAMAAARGHVRLFGTVHDETAFQGYDEVSVTVLGKPARVPSPAGAPRPLPVR